MRAVPTRAELLRALGPTFLLLLAGLVGFAFLGTLPLLEGIAVALVGLVAGAACRLSPGSIARGVAPIGPLAALGLLALAASPTAVPALYGGATALALLLWLAEDPDRLPGGPGRAVGRLLIPAAGLAIAWTSSFLLPGGVAGIGIAAALLGGVLVLVALLLRAPDLVDRAASASS
jgi:hypothetical protein